MKLHFRIQVSLNARLGGHDMALAVSPRPLTAEVTVQYQAGWHTRSGSGFSQSTSFPISIIPSTFHSEYS
jgi:hypothetical protein